MAILCEANRAAPRHDVTSLMSKIWPGLLRLPVMNIAGQENKLKKEAVQQIPKACRPPSPVDADQLAFLKVLNDRCAHITEYKGAEDLRKSSTASCLTM